MKHTKLACEKDLEITLETALMLAEPGTKIPDLARRIYSSETQLMEQLQEPWMIEHLCWMLNRKRRNVPNPAQGILPGMIVPGFEKLPRRITIANNRRAQLEVATATKLHQFRAVLTRQQNESRRATREQQDPRIEALDLLIVLVERYPAGTTVASALSQEAKKREAENWK